MRSLVRHHRLKLFPPGLRCDPLRPRSAVLALLLGAFIVSLAYGVALPILPFLLSRKLGTADAAWHTGLLTAAYSFALFLFAPFWGALSDRWQRRRVLLTGLFGFAVALTIFAFIDSLWSLYLGRFMSGAFAAAVLPVALATLADWAADERARARYFAMLNIAAIGGTLAGPALGGILGGRWVGGVPASGAPFLLLAFAAAAIAVLALFTLPASPPHRRVAKRDARPRSVFLNRLLVLALFAAWAVGTFEVGLALRAEAELNFGPQDIGVMFAECMIVMAFVQAIVFNRWFPPGLTRRLLAPAFIVLALSLLFLAKANTPTTLLLAVAGLAAAAGVISPVVSFWASLAAGDVQGRELGWQISAASVGQAIGSVAGGLLFGWAWGSGAFLLAALVMFLGAVVALRLARRLVSLAARGPAAPRV